MKTTAIPKAQRKGWAGTEGLMIAAIDNLRESFRFSRELEFFSESELTKQIGYSRSEWPLVIAKELIDNSLDACEESGVLPEISLVVTESSIGVTDNGPGIAPETVVGMLDFTVRESSRQAYRSLTRGAQGNAGKCILAVPFVMAGGNPEPVTIEAHGVLHRVGVAVDQLAQAPKIEYTKEHSKVHPGTRVHVALACKLSDDEIGDFLHLAFGYTVANPHLRLCVQVIDSHLTFERTVEQCRKWTAANPDPPARYDLPAFERLVGACINKDRQDGTDRPLGKFLERFAGLRGSATRKKVAEAAGLTRCGLSALADNDGLDHAKTRAILEAMQASTKPPKPEKLGLIGRQHVEQCLRRWTTLESEVTHKVVRGEAGGLPFVVEAAFAVKVDADAERNLFTGVNFSSSVKSFSRCVGQFLEDQFVYRNSRVVAFVHIATPSPKYTNHGKTELSLTDETADALRRCIESVTADWAREAKKRSRDEQRSWRPTPVRKPPKTTIKDACFAVMEMAIEKVSSSGSCEFSARDLYYAARKLMQEHTLAELTQGYFERIIDQWEMQYGLIGKRYREARGHLSEPHSVMKIQLGTREVDDYSIPRHHYQALLYFEKRGLESQLLWSQIPQRYDVAVMACEGYAVRAAKKLMQAAQEGHKIKVICFHDADPSGYQILQTLAQSS